MTDACPNARALSDAFARGDDALAAHTERCGACAKEWALLSEMRSAARALPYRPMTQDRIRAVRAQIVMATRSARQPASYRRAYLAVAASIVMISLGFASVLADLGLPQEALLLALVGFNVGVEAGQLAIVCAFLPLAFALRGTGFYRRAVFTGGSAAIALVAAVWLAERALDVKLWPL